MDGSAWEGAVGDVPGVAVGFAAFYTRHYRDTVGLALALTGDRWVAEDVAQEAFARALRRWDVVAGYEHGDAWVKRVVANLCVSRWRRLGAETRALARAALRSDRQKEVGIPEPAEEFWREVRALSPLQRQVVALHYVTDLPLAEIAALLDCPESTVKSHLRRARQRLAQRLEAAEGVG